MRDLLTDETKLTARGVAPSEPASAERPRRQRMLDALGCSPVDRPPVWLMRQAGRCLPEYRALKEKYSFRQLVQTPELAAEVTLQPVRRFNFDAAILFSDILVVPEAMGQGYSFREGGGVEMDFVLRDGGGIRRLKVDGLGERLDYVARALKLIKAELRGRAALLGFAGSPWTLANFMLDGGSATPHARALQCFRSDPVTYEALAGKLTEATIEYLRMQIACGVDAVQIFDSLGGLLPREDFEAASGRWIRAIVSGLRGRAPVIVYSKGTRDWNSLVRTGARAIGIDHEITLAEAALHIPPATAIQGNLDPALLATGEPGAVAAEATRLLEQMRSRRGFIFNLGHGVPADARMENLEALACAVQKFV